MSKTLPEGYGFYPGNGGTTAPCVYFIDLPEHPLDVASATTGLSCSVAKFPVSHWDDALTPWPAPGLYKGDADFGGQADATLDDIVSRIIPDIEESCGIAPRSRALAGYSLGGLFALYAFTRSDLFSAVASMSGSFWYDGWVDYLEGAAFDAGDRHAFLSLGSREKHAMPARLHTVEDNTRRSADLLEEHGVDVILSIGPGSHIQHVEERLQAGLVALDGWLKE
jgi:predicted alpha/beta superfamily hydrolase